jgi:hypothetical protein
MSQTRGLAAILASICGGPLSKHRHHKPAKLGRTENHPIEPIPMGIANGRYGAQAVWKQREIAVLADSALGEAALES